MSVLRPNGGLGSMTCRDLIYRGPVIFGGLPPGARQPAQTQGEFVPRLVTNQLMNFIGRLLGRMLSMLLSHSRSRADGSTSAARNSPGFSQIGRATSRSVAAETGGSRKVTRWDPYRGPESGSRTASVAIARGNNHVGR